MGTSGLLVSPEPALSSELAQRRLLSCTTGGVSCVGSETLSQPLLTLLAEDEMIAKKSDVVHLLAGASHTTVDDALSVEELKIMAKREIDRILASREVSDILGNGGKREFHRILHLLHPDKGLVSVNDSRANQALRLVFAARRATPLAD